MFTELSSVQPGERAHKKCNKDAFELGVVAQACGPSTWEAEEGVSGIQGWSWLQRKLEDRLGDLRAYLQTPNPNQTQTKKYLNWNKIKQGI